MNAKLLALACSITFVAVVLPTGPVDYATEVAPILKGKCVSCHGPEVQSGGLRLDTADAIRKGGVSGPLFTPGKGADSLLVQRLLGKGGKPRMPMGFAPLSADAIAKVTKWIDEGGKIASTAKHWAYMPPKRPVPPTVKNKAWAKNPIDTFVLARLEKEDLKPSLEATREQLARRVSLDLTGLPPTVQELQAFLKDTKPNAYERYVDRLLASPHYGERMARIWLDLARYADTNGYEKDLPRVMWPWRDWVIGAFNKNLPFDEFTVEQIAGDLLPNATRQQIIATGFHRNSMLNDEGGIDAEEFRVIAVMDRIDATATTWLGTTLACAQCHDHKYDPLTQKDYYSFFAFFNQSQDNGQGIDPTVLVPTPAQEAELTAIDAEIEKQNKVFEAKKGDVVNGQAAWEKLVMTGWSVPKPLAATGGATLTIQADGSVLASGPDPDLDTYTVLVPITASLAGIKVSVLPDPSLPEMSSGRNPNGSFVLGHIEAQVVHSSGATEPVKFSDCRADYTQEGHNPLSLISMGDGPGWAASAYMPEHRIEHCVALALEKAYVPQPGDHLKIILKTHKNFPHHNVGKFQISLTDKEELAMQAPVGGEVRHILNMKRRTVEGLKKVEDFFLLVTPELAGIRKTINDLKKRKADLVAKIPTTMVMKQITPARENHMLKRGDFRTPGDKVTAATPKALGGLASREDRLGLARWIVSPTNPLTARVEVNRLWEQCFGRGLVATPEDFGTQGERPSHPELLDWLATEFVARKWDVKGLLRLIVTSSTYRQSSRVSAALLKKDPYNILLARGARFRVEAEGVRDIALVASGRLTPTIGGPSVMPPQPGGIWENSFSFYDTKERWVDDTGPNRYRRGLYTYWRRTAPFPMALTFDMKSRDMCVAHRMRTNTPLQALNTLNDPLFVECAGALGQKMSKLGGDKGLSYGFQACTSRLPSAKELAALRTLLAAAKAKYDQYDQLALALLKTARVEGKAEDAAWLVVANAILNLDETFTRG